MRADWGRDRFRTAYVAAGGSAASARSYVTYLNRVDSLVGGLRAALENQGPESLLGYVGSISESSWASKKNRRDSLSALRRYLEMLSNINDSSGLKYDRVVDASFDIRELYSIDAEALKLLLIDIKSLAARYYALTGKPLGATGEIAELEAADKLGLTLCPPRTAWFDAIEEATGRRVQIKGKAVDPDNPYKGMCSAIRCGEAFHDVIIVLLDRTSSEPFEMWRAEQETVARRIANLESERRRSNGVLAVSQFKSIAQRVWPTDR